MSYKESVLRVSPYFGSSLFSENNDISGKKCDLNSLSKNNTSISSLSDIESWEHSSVSSLSWFDEFDVTSSLKIAQQLDNIDMVLYGEKNPAVLDKDMQLECEEWLRAFPHLRICGKSLRNKSTKSNITESSDENFLFSNIKESEASNNLETLNLEELTLKNDSNKSSIFKNKYENIWEKNNEDFIKMFHSHDHLKVTSAQQINHFPSAPSIIRSEISSSKWHRQENSDYSSLPFIHNISNNLNADDKLPGLCFSERRTRLTSKEKNKSSEQNKKTKTSRSKRCSSTMSKRNYSQTFSLQNKSVLPPIENASSVNKLNCSTFRSISATPRKYIPLVPISKSIRNALDEKCSSQIEKQFENQFSHSSHQSANKIKYKITPKYF